MNKILKPEDDISPQRFFDRHKKNKNVAKREVGSAGSFDFEEFKNTHDEKNDSKPV